MKKIVYIGTDKWSLQLEKLSKSNSFSIIHAVIPISSRDLLEICKRKNIPYTKIDNVNDLESYLLELDFDLYVVIGHPYLLQKPLLAISEGIGFHPSLLPKRRGRAPINWAIIDDLSESGVTLFKLEKKADNGLIYFQEKFPILKTDTAKTLIDKVNKILEDNLTDIIRKWPDLDGVKQNNNEASYTARRYPDDGEIKMDMSVKEADRLVRALTGPYPSAFIKLKDSKKLYIHTASLDDDES